MEAKKIKVKSENDEVAFLVKLTNNLSDDYDIVRTNFNEYHNVDYMVYKNQKLICYLELKTRADITKYVNKSKSLIMGATKIEKIDKEYSNTILIWFCETTKITYYSHYQSHYIDLPRVPLYNKYLKKTSDVRFIPLSCCSIGFDNLITDIIDY